MNSSNEIEILERISQSVRAVQDRLLRAVTALESAGISYALTDDNAVAAWVGQIDESAVRNTPDVTIVIRRNDLDTAVKALISSRFIAHSETPNLFVDDSTVRHGVQLFVTGERIISASPAVHPDVAESEMLGSFRVLPLLALVQIKLAPFRDRDRLNLRDLIDVGLIDQTWPARYPAELAARLQLLLDTPGG